jgi:hypothetical protein
MASSDDYAGPGVPSFGIPLCRKCERPLSEHSIFHDQPPEPVLLQEADFAVAMQGVYCPLGPEGTGSGPGEGRPLPGRVGADGAVRPGVGGPGEVLADTAGGARGLTGLRGEAERGSALDAPPLEGIGFGHPTSLPTDLPPSCPQLDGTVGPQARACTIGSMRENGAAGATE